MKLSPSFKILINRFCSVFFTVGSVGMICCMWIYGIKEFSSEEICLRIMLALTGVMISGGIAVLLTALWWMSNLIVADYKQEKQENKKSERNKQCQTR